MIKDVIVDIVGIQGIDDDTDTIEFTTEGRFGVKDDEYFISYEEGQMFEEKAEVKTRIFIKPDNSVVLERKGALNSRILIEKDKRNTAFYSTPLGELVISVFGEKIENKLNQNGGTLNLCYTIDSDLKLLSRNTVKISVREAN